VSTVQIEMAHIYLFICYQIILSPGQSIVDGLHWCCIQEILSALLFQIHRGFEGATYYILFDSGAVSGNVFCGPESAPITGLSVLTELI
jgi:hypothetical protein